MADISSTRESAIKNLDAQAELWRSQMKARIEHFNLAHESTKKLLAESESLKDISVALQTDALMSW